jgi:predicted PurR-regulated permease PerM
MKSSAIFAQQVLVALAVTISVAGALYGLYIIWEVLLLFFVAFILAAALRPTVLKLSRKLHLSLVASALLIQIALFTFIGSFIALVVPSLVRESTHLVNSASYLVEIPNINWDSIFTQNFDQITQAFASFESLIGRFGQSISSLLGIVNSVMTAIILTVTLFVIMYYFIVSYDHLARAFAWMLPGSKEERIARSEKILNNVSLELGGWIRGRFLVMFLIGVCTYIGLTLLGVPYALPLAIAATFLEIIPNIGPTLAAVPAVIISFFVAGPWMALVVTVFYIALQQVENSLITPQVMKQAVHVHPLTTLFLIMVGLHLMGVKGALLSLPVYIVVRSVMQEILPHQGPLGDLENVK